MSRSPFQGVATVFRFNWHFYVIAISGAALLMVISQIAPAWIGLPCRIVSALIVLTTLVSLAATWLAYDASGLYGLA